MSTILKPSGIYMFKWLPKSGIATAGTRPYKYDLPKNGIPGKWHSILNKRPIMVCGNGFHCIGLNNLIRYAAYGPRLFLVEVAGNFLSNGEKGAVEHIRFIKELEYDLVKRFNVNIIRVKNFTDLPGCTIKDLNDGYGKIGRDRLGIV